jgi:Zn-dependent peptidase ImmA (M78 family)
VYYKMLIEFDGLVEVEEVQFESERIKGLCVGRNIAISSRLETSTEKLCVLAEELGHFFTTSGNILDQARAENRIQEARARAWAYEFLIKPQDLVAAYGHGVRNRYDLAEYLGVTEWFLEGAVKHFEQRYWPGYHVDGHYIMFAPLRITKLQEMTPVWDIACI